MAVWPHQFELVLTIVLKTSSLCQQLAIRNTGDKPFDFTTLLHTYLRVDDISNAQIWGLKGLTYLDKPNNAKPTVETSDPVTFHGETDRVYIDAASRRVTIADGGNATLVIQAKGFRDVVVWNPAEAKAAAMSDLGAENWTGFVCVEVGSVNEPVALGRGEKWEGSQGISIGLKGGGAE